jgi:hypothetical protein
VNWPKTHRSALHYLRGENLEDPEPMGPGIIDGGERIHAFFSQSFVPAELRFVVHGFGQVKFIYISCAKGI